MTLRLEGLLPEHAYHMSFEVSNQTMTRTGADLMANGIVLKDQVPGELIYLGLPDFPGDCADGVTPSGAGWVIRRETNLGYRGVAVYRSAGTDNNWVGYYEVRRGTELLDRVRTGTYYFDHSPGRTPTRLLGSHRRWARQYQRLDQRQPPAGGSDVYAVLGSHGPDAAHHGWGAETTADGKTFTPMVWIPPAKSSAADFGGTPNQLGGVEGDWEGPGNVRVGRGWQQASAEVACVRTGAVPKDGQVRIVSKVMKEYYRRAMGKPLQVRILLGPTRYGQVRTGRKCRSVTMRPASCTISARMSSPGDTLRFVLERGTSAEDDIVAWMPRIMYSDREEISDGSVVRILCGSRQAYVDRTGNEWLPDRFFVGGNAVASNASVKGCLPTSGDQTLYQTGRQGNDFSYSIPVKPGLYTVRLKLAETTYKWSFERPFNVSVNGRQMLRNFDICQAARGSQTAYERVFRYLAPDADGRMELGFTGGWEPRQESDDAMVQAIEVLRNKAHGSSECRIG